MLLVLLVSAATPMFTQGRNSAEFAKREQASSEKEKIMELERQWARAEDTYDPGVLNEILGESFVSMNEAGEVKNKGQEIASDADWKASDPEVIDDISIRIDGHTAVVLGRFTYTDRDSGRVVRQGCFVDTFRRNNGRWQVIANTYVRTDVSFR